jgi:hypothetical protein
MRLLAIFLSLIWALVGAVVPGIGHGKGLQHFNVNVDGDEVYGCADIRVSSDDEVARAEESLTLPVGSAVRLSASRNGGVWIAGSEGAQIEIEACKVAIDSSVDRAQHLLSGVKVQQEAGAITATGPAGSRWHVYFVVRAPRGSSLSAETSNGPLSLRNADGSFTMRATNGPIAIASSRGTIDARTENGPISLKGGAGELTLRASNGPLSIKLDGVEWDGAGLTGETRNGPLSLSVPNGYRSGVLVESDGHSPMRCSSCGDARRTWDDDQRRIEFGGGPQIIKLTTSNGPVSVVQR